MALASAVSNAQHAVEIAVVKAESRALQAFVIGKHLLGARHVARRALQFNGVRPQVNGDVQTIFQHAHILVARAKQSLDVGTNPDAFLHSFSLTN